MEDNLLIDPGSIRAAELLDQIKKLNGMIDVHKNQSHDQFMVNQYQDMKNRFLNELKNILSEFEIEVRVKTDKAA